MGHDDTVFFHLLYTPEALRVAPAAMFGARGGQTRHDATDAVVADDVVDFLDIFFETLEAFEVRSDRSHSTPADSRISAPM